MTIHLDSFFLGCGFVLFVQLIGAGTIGIMAAIVPVPKIPK